MLIKFEPAFKDAEMFYEQPKPSAHSIPEWYKNIPLTVDGGSKVYLSEDKSASNMTLKGCSPFLDSLTAGYTMSLPCDIEISTNQYGQLDINWLIDLEEVVSGHDERQMPGMRVLASNYRGALKWRSGWRVITPKGYSTLFTHPLNRNDLPFSTLSGIVETDSYGLPVEFPFVLNNLLINEEKFILEKGTPIVQAIPFKRDNWKSEIVPFNEKQNKQSQINLKSKIGRSYKRQFWKNKKFL